MSYKEKPQLKLYAFENNAFTLKAVIDDYQEVSIERKLYEVGTFTVTINYNIPNALLFERGLFIQFGSDSCDFGEIVTISDTISEEGKGSQIRTITGYDARYILKRRVIKNMNSNGLWIMTAKGELCLRNIIKDQCGSGAETKRQLPIENIIPQEADAIGKVYSVSEQFTNLYEVCKTIATQTEIGWRIKFFNETLILECYNGVDKSQTVRFDTSYDSLSNGEFSDSSESFSNAIYVGGKGQNDDRDIYEGENGTPSGFDRFESWDNQSQMTVESEYQAEALSMLTQYGQTVLMNGNGLAKSPYVYKEQYNVGDWITVAFNGKSAIVQILSVTEHWVWGSYDIQFTFGKQQNNLADQLQLILRKIQSASNKESSTDSVRWYTIPTNTEMPKADVTYNTIGFIGSCAENGSTFKLYLDDEKTGAKTYHVYFKQLGGGNLTLTTGKEGATDLVLNSGTYVAIIYVDEDGNVTNQGATPTNVIISGNTQPATSGGVANTISSFNFKPATDTSAGKITCFSKNLTANSTYRKSILLLCDITALDGVSSGGSSYGFTGFLLAHRVNGYLREHCSEIIMTAAYKESNSIGDSLQLKTTDSLYIPIKIHNESTNKTYLGIQYSYSTESNVTFLGLTRNMSSSDINIVYLDSSTNKDSDGVTWTTKCTGLSTMLDISHPDTANGTALRIRTSAPSSPSNGDIWIS